MRRVSRWLGSESSSPSDHEERREPARHFAYAVKPAVHEENSNPGHQEPNMEAGPQNSVDECFEEEEIYNKSLSEDEQSTQHHQMKPVEGELDESTVCLLDTACTSCMHSRAWRVAFSRHLPPSVACQMTNKTKMFHFANGSSTESRANVWKIPVVFGGRRGEVHSAEIPTGSAPLLLSVAAMEAMDMVLLLKDRKVQIRSLGIEVPMMLTKTRHRAIDVVGSGDAVSLDVAIGKAPTCRSDNDDLFLYLVEEAAFLLCEGEPKEALSLDEPKTKFLPNLSVRGVKTTDERGYLSQRRERELADKRVHLRKQDLRTWAALRRDYTFAEQAATKQFSTTVICEPWGGCFGVTRFGSLHYGWTNSQPLDVIDGYDLLTIRGQHLLWRTLEEHDPYLVLIAFDCRLWSLLNNLCQQKEHVDWVDFQRDTIGRRTIRLVVSVCLHRHQRGRYYLVENPAGSYAWVYEELFWKLIEQAGGKFIINDQCAFGKVDAVSGRPTRKSTGWLSNSEHLLNTIGKRCKCKFGAHQPVVGQNKYGQRSKQAAAYPAGLCRAICQGILQTMKFDYALRVEHELSYPVEDSFPEELPDVEEVDPEDADFCESQEGKIVRHHIHPRRSLFSPMSVEHLPVDFRALLPRRVTFLKFEDGHEEHFEDEWTNPDDPYRRKDASWTGRTEIDVKSLEEFEDQMQVDLPSGAPETPVPAPGTPAPATPGGTLRRRPKTRQLQRGFWQQVQSEELADLLDKTLQWLLERGGNGWQVVPLGEELGQSWIVHESANAEVNLILAATDARKLRKPQPFASPAEAPLRKANLLLKNNTCLSTAWEDWFQQAPTTHNRPLVAQQREVCVILFGAPLGEIVRAEPDDSRSMEKEKLREQHWSSLPRELKLALKRVHVNLGHATVPQMLKAMRVSRASEVAIRACRLFRCPDCPRLQQPKQQRPSKLPLTEEFNVQLGLDIFTKKDADGNAWSWLNVLCQGTTFQICCLLEDSSYNPTGATVLKAFEQCWTSWAGFPEYGLFTDRAKYFLSDFAEALASEGCYFESAARAAPWQLGQVERHGAIWKSILTRMIWSEQLSGKEAMIHATSAVNNAKNNLVRKAGFSPSQWVLGRSIRLPSDLTDDAEATRLGSLALTTTPTSRFYLKSKLRFSAREAFMQVANSEALKRAELRKVRPHRGPFPVGTYVFFFDASDQKPGPSCWRGIARVIGHEGSHTVWLSHRGLLIAVSPEHLAMAFDEEVRQWTTIGSEVDLLDTQPAAGGTSFIDLRKQPKPPAEGFDVDKLEEDDRQKMIGDGQGHFEPLTTVQDVDMEYTPSVPDENVEPPYEQMPEYLPEDLSSDLLSMARMRYESERDAKKDRKSSEFFAKVREERKRKQEERRQKWVEEERRRSFSSSLPAAQIPIPGAEFDPDLDDYHVSAPSSRMPAISENLEDEAQEREAKRLRVGETESAEDASLFAYAVVEQPGYLLHAAERSFWRHAQAYAELNVSCEDFLFAFKRNVFDDKYCAVYDAALGATPGTASTKKRGRKEIFLKDLSEELQQLFTGPGGSDEREWHAWIEKDAIEILDEATSKSIRRNHPDLVIPTRWVRTNKAEGLEGQSFVAKSRLVVQGFKDKSLGFYRRDAPTASALAESICLAVSAHMSFTVISKDVKNAYFSGRSLDREIYLSPPKGGLGNLKPTQLLRAKKAIYGFSEAARMFWVALKGYLESDGWTESRLEPALFFLRGDDKQLRGILVTHVDDVEGGVHPDHLETAFQHSSKALEFATNHFREFVFRGREIKQHKDNHVDVSMRNYSLSTRSIKIDAHRRKQPDSPLTEEEFQVFQSGAGELGWLTRQLRCDLCFENGVIQRAKSTACVEDLIRLKQYLASAKRGADFRMRYWSDVDLRKGVLIHLADSGHANGTPEKDGILRYRSVGGYFLLLANPEILENQPAKAVILAFHSSQTKRVCRSTLAAEASHLAEAVEAGDWCCCLLEEALLGELNLRDWPSIIHKRQRVYVTDAKSVFDYLQKDATSTSTDKRMAIEGALLRETVRQPNAWVRWIDGMQNIANVLTKANTDKTVLQEFLRSGMMTLVQTEENKQLKEKKRLQRQARKIVLDAHKQQNQQKKITSVKATCESEDDAVDAVDFVAAGSRTKSQDNMCQEFDRPACAPSFG